ncbi:hypothetical protein RAC89_22590 [Paenibacillus sp. GD4]|uniref:hypothetical protein n=1 Tax=Paenibacillus sp. GD4 TaxID=3068890 RepID=UPI002796549E|nr:hypothetical protein [Paenibacillus sp. GD4]MDQ1913188.1 hypothetical protein [Paenibacillus sp. GD4]
MRALAVLGFSLLCAIFLSLFSHIQDLLKYVFSLGALFAGIQFFKRYEERSLRIWFVALTIVFYFIFAFIYAVYVAMQQMPAPS